MKKLILYFEELDFQKETMDLIKSKFEIINSKRLKNNHFSKIVSIILPMNDYYSGKFFSKFSKLRTVLSPTTGNIHLDTKYLFTKNIKIINLSNQKNRLNQVTTTSELAIGHILNLTRKILIINNEFILSKIFNKHNYLLSNNMLTIGIVGMGRIGRHLADRAAALGFKVIYFDPFVNYKKYIKMKSLKNLIKKSNILTIHMHYKKKYFNTFNLKVFKMLKKPSYFINTARGEFVNEKDIIKSLKKGILNGAGLDVLKSEYSKKFRADPKKNVLLDFFIKNKKYNLFITPKQGGSNKSAWALTEKIIVNQLIKYEKNRI